MDKSLDIKIRMIAMNINILVCSGRVVFFCPKNSSKNGSIIGVKYFPFSPYMIGDATADHIKYMFVKIR